MSLHSCDWDECFILVLQFVPSFMPIIPAIWVMKFIYPFLRHSIDNDLIWPVIWVPLFLGITLISQWRMAQLLRAAPTYSEWGIKKCFRLHFQKGVIAFLYFFMAPLWILFSFIKFTVHCCFGNFANIVNSLHNLIMLSCTMKSTLFAWKKQ